MRVIPCRRVPIRVVLVALSMSTLLGACSTPPQDHVAATCRNTGDLLRTLVRGSQDEHDEDLSPIVDRVVEAARSSREPALSEPAERLWGGWQDSQADDEAAPTAGFGTAVNELAAECVDRGFTYPDIGFD